MQTVNDSQLRIRAKEIDNEIKELNGRIAKKSRKAEKCTSSNKEDECATDFFLLIQFKQKQKSECGYRGHRKMQQQISDNQQLEFETSLRDGEDHGPQERDALKKRINRQNQMRRRKAAAGIRQAS